MQDVKVFHIVTVKYHGATNTRGSRVSLYSERFQKRIYIPFDYSERDIESMAVNYLIEHGFKIVGYADGYVITDTFESIEKTVPCKHDSAWLAGFECTLCGDETFLLMNEREDAMKAIGS